MKLLIRAAMTEKRIKELEGYFDTVVYNPWTKTGEWYEEDKMLELLQKEQPDVLITELDRVKEIVLKSYTKLKIIGDCRASPANIDSALCKKMGIPIICTPARNAQAVAELLVGLLICFLRNVIPAAEWERQGKWVKGQTPYYNFMGNEIQGKKIGFVGFGAVGRSAAALLQAFGTEILFYDPFVAAFDEYKKFELQPLFESCDIISIHLPVTPATNKMINKKLLEAMKPDAVFINTARSAVVDMDALYEVVTAKKIRGAILDVLDSEPPTEEELKKWSIPQVLLTPHICGSTFEVTDHQSDIITERLIQWLKGENLEKIIYKT